MLLAVDVGNTETVLALFAGDRLVRQWRVTSAREQTGDEVFVLVHSLLGSEGKRSEDIDGVAVCSGVPGLTAAYEALGRRLTGGDPLIVSPETAGIPVRYPDPSSIGPDRLANAVGVLADHGAPALVVDLGTATTFDVVDGDGAYLGGVIVPGILTSASALFSRGARLPRVEIRPPARYVGRTTEECIQSGVFHGSVGAIDALTEGIFREQGFADGTPVIATGGLAEPIAAASRCITGVDSALTVKGIRRIWERQRG